MYIEIITFNLSGMTEQQWREQAERNATKYAECRGLLAKLWMSNPETNTCGAVYLWKDKETLDEHNRGPLAERVRTHPNYRNQSITEFKLLEDLVRKTQPGLKIV
jgi:hypothetical protein